MKIKHCEMKIDENTGGIMELEQEITIISCPCCNSNNIELKEMECDHEENENGYGEPSCWTCECICNECNHKFKERYYKRINEKS